MYTLNRHQRLKGRKKIQILFAQGSAFNIPPFRIVYLKPDVADENLQAGFSVSKKKFKKATSRNRIKRLMRESWRTQCLELRERLQERGKYLAVFFIYTGSSIPEFEEVKAKMKQAIGGLLEIM